MREQLQEIAIWLVPIIILAIKSWLAGRDADKAKAARAKAELEAELERLASKAIVLGVQKLKEHMTEEKKQETNSTIKAFTESAGVEDRVNKIVEEVKKGA